MACYIVKMLVVQPYIESDNLNFETLLHNFTSISTISPNFRTICPLNTENSSSHDLGRRKRSGRKKTRGPEDPEALT